MSSFNFTQQDCEKAKYVLCKVCKKVYQQPVILPCFNNLCKSHLDEFIKYDDQNEKKKYFDCLFCKEKHFIENKEFSTNEMLIFFLNQSEDRYSSIYGKAKNYIENVNTKITNFEKKKTECEKYLTKYFTDLKSRIELKKEEIIKQIYKEFNDLVNDLNIKEKKYIDDANKIINELELDDVKLKFNNYKQELNEYNVDLLNWAKLIDNLELLEKKININSNKLNEKLSECKDINYKGDNLAQQIYNELRSVKTSDDTTNFNLNEQLVENSEISIDDTNHETSNNHNNQTLDEIKTMESSECDDKSHLAKLVSKYSKRSKYRSNNQETKDEKTFKCHLCPFKTNILGNLKNHINQHKQKKGCLKCRYCSYFVLTGTQLKIHETIHPEYTAPVSTCSDSKTFFKESQKATLKYNYCKICPYKSIQLKVLTEHSKLHNYQKGYPKCRYCEYYVSTSRLIKRHEILHAEYKPILAD